MMDRTTAWRTPAQEAALLAAERAADQALLSQERARMARVEVLEQRIHRSVQALCALMTALWLLALLGLLAMEVWF